MLFGNPPCLRRRVIVNFTHDETSAFEGVLWSYDWGGWMTLRDVSALKSSAEPAKIPGEIIVHRSQVAYVQVLP